MIANLYCEHLVRVLCLAFDPHRQTLRSGELLRIIPQGVSAQG